MLYWISKTINIFFDIIPIGWALYLINFFSPNNLLEDVEGTINGWALILISLLLIIVIGGLIIKRIEQMFTSDNVGEKGYGAILLIFQWAVGIIKTRELLEKLSSGRNLNAIMFSLLFILFLFAFSFNGIRTAGDLIDWGIKKEQQNLENNETNETNETNATNETNEYNTQNLQTNQQTPQQQQAWEKLKEDVNSFGKGAIYVLSKLKYGEEVQTPAVLIQSQINQNQEQEPQNQSVSIENIEKIMSQKRIAQNFFLKISLNINKPVSDEITYYIAGLPLEPISFSKTTNFVYFTFLFIVILVFWLIIIAISPLLDFFTVLFSNRKYDYIDYIGMIIRLCLAILFYFGLLNAYTL